MRSDHTMEMLYFKLFGRFEVTLKGRRVQTLKKQKADKILAFLVLNAPNEVEKDTVAKLFWSTENVYDPADCFRQALSYIRKQLEEGATCIESPRGGVRIELNANQADLFTYLAACERGDADSLALATRLADEQLLEGWDDPWINKFRERMTKKLDCATRRLAESTISVTLPIIDTPHLPEDLTEEEVPSGTPPNPLSNCSDHYIERDADHQLCQAIQYNIGAILLKGPRQVGKSLLLMRGLDFAARKGHTILHTDLDTFAPEDLSSLEQFYKRLMAHLAEQMDICYDPSTDWSDLHLANDNLERFFVRRLLPQATRPILWGLDSVDRLFPTSFYTSFFACLRAFHSYRASKVKEGWNRVSLLLASATEAHLYIRDLDSSPFNVAQTIQLDDLTPTQSRELHRRYGLCDTDLTSLVGGHPYLLIRGLRAISSGTDPRDLQTNASLPVSPFRDHLEGILRYLRSDGELREATCAVLKGQLCTDSTFFRLRSAGVLLGTGPEDARLRCELYRRYFARHLL